MKINAITFNKQIFNRNNYKNISKEPQKYPHTTTPNFFSNYPAFCGGYSVNLAQTYQNLKDSDYPNLEIKNSIKETLDELNPQNKTLCDIHFEKYKGVLDCFSLEELKEKYPEFKNVISAWEVEAKDESFVGQFQNDKSEIFKSSEDLTLQLIKLYWGQGFSLGDLSKHIAAFSKNQEGLNIHYAMTQKLNIPLMTPRYASILKLSNKEYNEKLAQEMSIKIKEANEAKLQKQEGEAVIIPKGPLSEAHKKHISEGLKKHYLENPERIYEFSQRQKDFYAKNPQKKEEMSEIMLYAWNSTFEGKKLIKHLIKHLKKYNISISQEELTLKNELTPKQCLAFKNFWEKNMWARKELSQAMKKAYEYMSLDTSLLIDCKTIPGECMTYQTIPAQLAEKIRLWCRKNGYNEQELLTQYTLYKSEEEQQKHLNKRTNDLMIKSNKLMDLYEKEHQGMQDFCAECYLRAILSIRKAFYFEPYRLPQSIKNNETELEMMKLLINELCSKVNMYTEKQDHTIIGTNANINNETLVGIIQAILKMSMALNSWDFGEYFAKELNNAYTDANALNNY